MIEFSKIKETWQFDLSQRDGGMIAIMCNEEDDPNFHAVYELPIDVIQEPMTWMGIYPTYLIDVDVEACAEKEIDLVDLRESIEIWIEQNVRIAYRYNPLDRRPDYNEDTYIRQRHAVESLEDTL